MGKEESDMKCNVIIINTILDCRRPNEGKVRKTKTFKILITVWPGLSDYKL